MALVGAFSHFGIAFFPTLGRHTLIFINVASFHLTPVSDLKGNKSSFILHSSCIHTLSLFYTEESLIVNEMSSPSFTGSNSLRSDLDSLSTNNAPPTIPNPIPPPLSFPIFPLPPQVFLPQTREVQPWEGNEEEEEEEDSNELQLKAEEGAVDASQASSNSSVTAFDPSSGFDSNLRECEIPHRTQTSVMRKRMKRKKRRRNTSPRAIPKKTLIHGETQMPIKPPFLKLPTFKPTTILFMCNRVIKEALSCRVFCFVCFFLVNV